MPLRRRAIEADLIAIDVTEQPQLRSAERFDSIRIGFRDVPRGVDFVVEHDQRALAARGRRQRRAHAVEEIQRPVCADRRRGSHRSHEHHRAIVPDRQVEKVRGLLERVGAVRDHDPGHSGVSRENRVDPPGHRQPVVERDVGARDVDDLLDLHIGELRDLRNRRDQLLAEDGPRAVVGQVRPGVAAARNRAAGRQHPHARLRRRRLRVQGNRAREDGRERQLFHRATGTGYHEARRHFFLKILRDPGSSGLRDEPLHLLLRIH